MRITYEAFDTNPLLPSIKPAIEDLVRRFAPHWLLDLRLCGPESEFCHRVSGGRASCQVHPEYFKATIGLHTQFMADPPNERLLAIVHEIAHLYTCPHYDALMDWLSEEKRKEFREATENRWLEFSTCSLENQFMKSIGDTEVAAYEKQLQETKE